MPLYARPREGWHVVPGVILVLALLAVAEPATACIAPGKPLGLPTATVERVSDGDTVRLRFPDGRRERTRLLGLDAPEEHDGPKLERDVARTGQDRAVLLAQGRRASVFARQLIPHGVTVEVERDLRTPSYLRLGRLVRTRACPSRTITRFTIAPSVVQR